MIWCSSASSCDLLQVLYAAALIPIGLLADRVNRPRLLAGGLVMWSLLTMTGSKVTQFVLKFGKHKEERLFI